jgi:membrane protease YdiL (CAAX protease family)
MIQGYRMAGPPPHGEPPAGPPPEEREWPPWLGFVTLGAVIVVSQVALGLVFSISGEDVDDTPAWLDLTSAVILQSSLLASALLAAYLVKPLHAWQFGLRPAPFWRSIGWAALGLVVFYVLAAVWVTIAGDPDQSTAEDVGADESDFALVAAGFLFIFVAPVVEEVFFRGFFYGSLRTRLGVAVSALLCGGVFGLIHAGSGIEAVPILIALGIIFCLVREKTGSLYPCIAMHALNNTLAYIGQADAAPEVAAAFGATMIAATCLVPRFAWRKPPPHTPRAA